MVDSRVRFLFVFEDSQPAVELLFFQVVELFPKVCEGVYAHGSAV